MLGLKSSGNSPASKKELRGAAYALLLLAALIALIAWVSGTTGISYLYGDAEAHLNIARRLTDSRTPGPSQIGTVWLPLPHLLVAPLAAMDVLWYRGVAGIIPSAICFLLATALIYLSALRIFESHVSGMLAAALFALNPNMLFLAFTAMTEPIMAAAIAGLLYATLRYRDEHSTRWLLVVAVVSNAACLTRYEGWFLIPFVALYIWTTGGFKHALWFSVLASLAPIAWLAHNQFYYDDPLAFYRGPYSAQAILQRQLDQGMTQPAMGNWSVALRYYSYALKDVLSTGILVTATFGVVIAIVLKLRRSAWPLTMLALPGAFYVWSIHSGGTPVFVPELPPFTLYNTRYALTLLPFASIASSVIAVLLSRRQTILAATILGVIFYLRPITSLPTVWAEASYLNRSRETTLAGEYLAAYYRPGSGIIFRFSELSGVFRSAHIPLREGLYQDNLPQWNEALASPQVFQHEEWALAEEGDEVDQAVQRQGSAYQLVDKFDVKGKPAILIYRRSR